MDEADQLRFAHVSGDHNPLHIDELAARRLPFGRRAVHGVHLLCRALDQWSVATAAAPEHIRATFRRSAGIGDLLSTTFTDSGLTVAAGPATIADVLIERGPRTATATIGAPIPDFETVAADPDVDDLEWRSGVIAIGAAPGAEAMFRNLADAVGRLGLAELLATTRLIGMRIPGRRSLFSALDLQRDAGRATGEMTWHVKRVDRRFNRVVIAVRGSVWSGELTAFVRPEPVAVDVDTSLVAPDAFADQRWLIVGGSRGLGAATASLVAAGGADVRLTYRAGSADAERAASACGGTSWHFNTDHVGTGLAALTADGWRPTHLGWFASPPIFVGAPGVYDSGLYRRFHRVYVDTFRDAVERLDLDGVLWPSSAAIDERVPGMGEYIMAKTDGEHYVASLRGSMTASAPRLPRIATDQSTSFVPTEFADPTAELLAALQPFSR